MMLRQVKFLRELIANEPSHRAIGETAEFFARAEGIGTIQGARVAYAPRDFVAARNLLTSRGFEAASTGQLVPRSQVQPGESEKWGSLRVSEGMVAVVPLGLAGLQIPAGSMLCTDVRKALALPYEVLVFCENLEPMMLLQTYRWLAGFLKGRPAMALFRGAQGISAPMRRMSCSDWTTGPCWPCSTLTPRASPWLRRCPGVKPCVSRRGPAWKRP